MKEFSLAEKESAFLQRKERITDPVPWIADKLDARILQDIYRITVEALAQVAELDMQVKQVERDMYRQIAKTLG